MSPYLVTQRGPHECRNPRNEKAERAGVDAAKFFGPRRADGDQLYGPRDGGVYMGSSATARSCPSSVDADPNISSASSASRPTSGIRRSREEQRRSSRRRLPEQGYNFTEDMTNKAIN